MKKMRGQLVLVFAVIITVVLLLPSKSFAYISQFNSPATVAVGQIDFVSKVGNQEGSAGANTLNGPFSPFSDGTKLFVADYFNSRVLIYNTIPTTNNTQADVVIGQPDFSSVDANQGGSVAANTLNQPTHVYSDGTKLFITDYVNSRILIYNTIPTTNNASADVVVGQADMTSGDRDRGVGQPTAAANGLDWPREAYSDGTKLYVADPGNHRSLIYNTVPTSNGASADVAIGQSDLTSYSQNNGLGGLNSAANSLSQPYGIFANDGKLFISDYGNNRVLIFNSIPTSHNASADVVIGQPNMTVNETNQGGVAGANTLGVPESTHSDGTRLFVSDTINNRVLIYNTIPTTNNASADAVIGQPDFSSGAVNQGGVPSARTIYSSRGAFLVGTKLIIAESGNHRMLIRDVSPGITVSSTAGVGPISINWGEESTMLRRVTLMLKAEGAKEMMISNNPDFSGASWETYVVERLWDLSDGNSIKTVYIKFRDFALFESATYSDYIELPSLPETGGTVRNIWSTIFNLIRLIF